MSIKITHNITNGETTTPIATVEVNAFTMAEVIEELDAAGIKVLPAQTRDRVIGFRQIWVDGVEQFVPVHATKH